MRSTRERSSGHDPALVVIARTSSSHHQPSDEKNRARDIRDPVYGSDRPNCSGRPGLRSTRRRFGIRSPTTHRANDRGVTIVISSLIAEPSRLPSFTKRLRSRSVTVTFLGRFERRMRFSSLRYSTIWASFRSVTDARMNHNGWSKRGMIERAFVVSMNERGLQMRTGFRYPAGGPEGNCGNAPCPLHASVSSWQPPRGARPAIRTGGVDEKKPLVLLTRGTRVFLHKTFDPLVNNFRERESSRSVPLGHREGFEPGPDQQSHPVGQSHEVLEIPGSNRCRRGTAELCRTGGPVR